MSTDDSFACTFNYIVLIYSHHGIDRTRVGIAIRQARLCRRCACAHPAVDNELNLITCFNSKCTPPLLRATPANPADTAHAGYALIFISLLFFVVGIYSTAIAGMMPIVGHSILDAVARDDYYTLLVPLLIPVITIAAYLNWLGLKFFRQNS